MLCSCIDKLASDDEVFEFKDYSQEEVDEFMESLTSDVIKQITLFFQTMPRLKNSIKYTNSNGDEKIFVIEGMQTFFS